jgi:hypothetical protein
MIRDEDLLLYHYGEGLDPALRAEVAAQLRADAGLVQRFRQLLADLEAVSSQSQVSAPAATRARWSAHLQAAAAAEARGARKPAVWRSPRWSVVLATVAALGVGMYIGSDMRTSPAVPDMVAVAAADSAPNGSFERGLRLHLAQTERLLVGLDSTDPATRANLLNDVIEQNRLFARAATLAKEDRLARVLRSFDALLVEMAGESVDSTALQSNSDRLGFELAVMQTKLAQAPSKATLQL